MPAGTRPEAPREGGKRLKGSDNVRELVDASLLGDEAAERFLDVKPIKPGYEGAPISTLPR